VPRLGLDAVERSDHALDVGDRGLRLLGGDLEFELRVLVGVGLQARECVFRLGDVGIDRERLSFLEQLLVLQLLLGLLQVGLDRQQYCFSATALSRSAMALSKRAVSASR
jgi:hypothetical protein